MNMFLYILLMIVLAWSVIVQTRLKRLAREYSDEPVASGKTANQCAEEMLRMNDVYGITFDRREGTLTDCYSPKDHKIYLSETTYGSNSITAVAVAAHECGHACQDANGMFVYKIRQLMAPAAGIASRISVFIVLAGLIFMYAARTVSSQEVGYNICTVGIALYTIVFLFYLVTLPIERNASRRGLAAMKEAGWVDDTQLKAARKVLWAAGDTYAVALASSAVMLLRLIAMRSSKRR